MAFRDFTFPEVQKELGLTIAEADLFSAIRASNSARNSPGGSKGGTDLALAIYTEKRVWSSIRLLPHCSLIRTSLADSFGLFL